MATIDPQFKHETWSSESVFLMAAIGGAVGLGNLWRFPFLAGQSGGGAFVLIYIAFVVLLCLPLVGVEPGDFAITASVIQRNPEHMRSLSLRPDHTWQVSSRPGPHTRQDSRRTKHSDAISSMHDHNPRVSARPEHSFAISRRMISTQYGTPEGGIAHHFPELSRTPQHFRATSNRPVHEPGVSASRRPWWHSESFSGRDVHNAARSISERPEQE